MTLPVFTPGFRLIDGSDLNLMVAAINGAAPLDGLANGSAAAPSLSFANSATTGLYRVGSNVLGVAAAGSLVGSFTSTGFQGAVGATTPAAGTFTVLTATTGVDGILGGVTPAAATVTTLTASTGVNGILGNATPAAATVTTLTSTAFVDESAATTLSAAGTTRTDALALTKAINNVTTALASTGVVLPASATVGVGGRVIVYNNGANAIKVYAAGSDTIDGTAGSTGVTLTNALRCEYRVIASGAFLSAKLGATST